MTNIEAQRLAQICLDAAIEFNLRFELMSAHWVADRGVEGHLSAAIAQAIFQAAPQEFAVIPEVQMSSSGGSNPKIDLLVTDRQFKKVHAMIEIKRSKDNDVTDVSRLQSLKTEGYANIKDIGHLLTRDSICVVCSLSGHAINRYEYVIERMLALEKKYAPAALWTVVIRKNPHYVAPHGVLSAFVRYF